MEALRGMISPFFLASCRSLDNVPGFLILVLLRAIRAPGLPRSMGAQLDYKDLATISGNWKGKKLSIFLGLEFHFPGVSSTFFWGGEGGGRGGLFVCLFYFVLFNRYSWAVAKPIISGYGSIKFNFLYQVPFG